MTGARTRARRVRRARRDGRTWQQRLLLGSNAVMIVAALGLAWLLNASWNKTASVNRVELSGALTPANPTTPGKRVINILLVGSDSSAGLDPDDPVAAGRVGERNGDVIIIAHLDERDGSAALLSLPRDLWVPIADSSRQAKINSAFAVGGPSTLIETIEEGLGIPINYFVNVDFAGFEGLVEAVGSVDIFFESPARDWNATHDRTQTGFEILTTGCQTLDPPTALSYVRSRYYQTQDVDGRWITDPDGDLGRIRRQQDFLQRLMQRAIDLGARNPFVLSDLVDAGLDNVSLDQDLTPQLLLDLGRTYAAFEPGSLATYSYPAVFGEVGTNSVLFPLTDEAVPLVALFGGEASDSPATVRVRIVHDQDESELADDLRSVLVEAGFDLPVASAATADPGIVIRHGVDGLQAAGLVLAALDEVGVETTGVAPRLEETGGLLGRDVVVVVGATVDNTGAEKGAAKTDESATDGTSGPSPTVGDSARDAVRPTTEPTTSSPSGELTSTSVGDENDPLAASSNEEMGKPLLGECP